MAQKFTTEEFNQRLEAADKALCELYRAAKDLAVASQAIETQLRARHDPGQSR